MYTIVVEIRKTSIMIIKYLFCSFQVPPVYFFLNSESKLFFILREQSFGIIV